MATTRSVPPAARRWPARALARLQTLAAAAVGWDADVSATPPYLLRLAVVAAAAAWLVCRSVTRLSVPPALVAAALVFLLTPRLALIDERRRRDQQFGELLPDAIDMVARVIRAGLPVAVAIRTAASEAEPPVATVFAMVADRIEIGVPAAEALAAAAEHCRDPDFRFFAVAVGLQQGTGGNLVLTLETLSDIIRKRRALRLRARATTAEVRMSALVLGSIPFIVGAALLGLAPDYLYRLFLDPRGNIILGLALSFLLAAAVVMRRMIREVELTAPLAGRASRARRGAAGGRFAAIGLTGDRLELARQLGPLVIRAQFAPRLLAALQLATAGTFAGLLTVPGLAAGGTVSDVAVLAALGLALGWSVPHAVLDRLRDNRRRAVARGLPDTIELLTVAVEAGLSLEDGLGRIVKEMWYLQPALAGELALTAAEFRLLPDREEALRRLAERVGLPSLHAVVMTLSQTLRYGTPLSHALRSAASELRSNALLLLEEQANRLPVLLTVPMVLFIIPSIFLVVGGPAFLTVLDAFAR